MRTLLGRAVGHGRPTTKQLFAFSMIWLVPDAVRRRVRAALHRPPASDAAPVGETPSLPRRAR
jgi:hypothetical protein